MTEEANMPNGQRQRVDLLAARLIETEVARREAVRDGNHARHNDLANMNRDAIGEAAAHDLRSLAARWTLERGEAEFAARQAPAEGECPVSADDITAAVTAERERVRRLLTAPFLAAIRCVPDGTIRNGCVISDGAQVRERARQAYRDAFPVGPTTEPAR